MRTFATVVLAALTGAAFSQGAAADLDCPTLPAGADIVPGFLELPPFEYEDDWGIAGRLHVYIPFIDLSQHVDAWTGLCFSPPQDDDAGGGGGGGSPTDFLARVDACEYLLPLQGRVPEISIETQNEFLECVTE